MYIVLYAFYIKPNKETDFIKGWKGLTTLIYQHEGSLGSRLHKKEKLNYIAYAQWPSKSKFENSGSNMPKEADSYRNLMKDSCSEIKIIEKLEVIEDLLKTN